MSTFKPNEAGIATRAAKRFIPSLSRALLRGRGVTLAAMGEVFFASLQGKGAGSGWDIENEVAAVARFVADPRPVVFDVGANIGDWSATLLKHCQPRTIVLFEPAPSMVNHLHQRDLPNAVVVDAAVGANIGKATFYMSDQAMAASSLYQRKDTYFESAEVTPVEVAVTTIDHTIADLGIASVDVLKMDVEGAELDVLRGMSQCLRDRRVKVLTFEFGSGNLNSRTQFRDFWDLLSQAGFDIYRICPGGVVLPIREYYEDLEYYRGVSNYIAALR